MATEGTPERTAEQPPVDVQAELRTVLAKAKAGDMAVLPQLRTMLDRNPALVKHYGDIAKQAEDAWVGLAGGSNLYFRESLVRQTENQRTELTRPGATPIEKLLVERVVATTLQLGYFEATEASCLAAGDSYRQLMFHSKRLAQAQRMHLAAMGALVTYQKLMPVEAVVVEERVLANNEQEEQTPAQAPLEQAVPCVPTLRVGTEVDEPERETRESQRERVRVRA